MPSDGCLKMPIRVAFFWVGNQTFIPETFVRSMRLVHSDGIEIVQTTDATTPVIPGVDVVVRSTLSEQIMLARLEAYSAVPLVDDFTFFYDADSLLISELSVPSDAAGDILLTRRQMDGDLNPNYPEFYPEFVGKKIADVMPYMFGCLAVRRNANFFPHLLDYCKLLPPRFHRWYGDQMSLAATYSAFNCDGASIRQDTYLHLVSAAPSVTDYFDLSLSGVRLITFKGESAKLSIPLSYERLEKFFVLRELTYS